MAKRRHPTTGTLSPDAPLFHRDHARPVTRRDFLAQGFISGTGLALGGSLFSLFANPRMAQAALSADLQTLAASTNCGLGGLGAGKIPFICFDLAGGSNMIGSNVLAGGPGGFKDSPISTAGYSKMGIPGDMVPFPSVLSTSPVSGPSNEFFDATLGLPFHSDSGFLRGILEKTSVGTTLNINGTVIPARSDNDTGNNPHNPMYGIAKAGADGSIVTLVGSRNSESGGNSVAPANMVDTAIRPTKIDRPSDVTGMVDTGNLTAVLSDPEDVKAVMESVVRLSDKKVDRVDTQITADAVIKDLVKCGYLKAADIADRFAGVDIDPGKDAAIFNQDTGLASDQRGTAIFSQDDLNDGEFSKTASVMKMVLDGYAGAGTITMGGYDYHTGDRSAGESRDLRAGRCMGACLEYAAIRGVPLMIYVCSDGSVASNGTLDGTDENDPGRGKGVWTGDNSSTAGSFFLVYNPGRRPLLLSADPDGFSIHKQIGWFRTSDGSVETASSPAANNVNLLVDVLLLNYLSLHGEVGLYNSLFGNSLGNSAAMDGLTAFTPICNGVISSPV